MDQRVNIMFFPSYVGGVFGAYVNQETASLEI